LFELPVFYDALVMFIINDLMHMMYMLQVLIKVSAIGVNPCDTYARSGNFGIPASKLPFILGYDCAGVIVWVGADVSRLKVNHWISVQPHNQHCCFPSIWKVV